LRDFLLTGLLVAFLSPMHAGCEQHAPRSPNAAGGPRADGPRRGSACRAAPAAAADTAARPYGLLTAAAASGHLGLDEVANPYDPDEVQVDVKIVFPGGTTRTHPAFWYVPMEPFYVTDRSEDNTRVVQWERFRPTADGEWRVRFSPKTEGDFSWHWSVAHRGRKWTREGGNFSASGPPSGTGPVGLRRGERYFRHANGSSFYPIGENLGWPEEAGSRIYGEWLRRLSEAGGNAARLWLVHYMCGTALEWSPKPVNPGFAEVGRYSQESAARVDLLLAAAERHNIRIILSFFSFGDTNWDWEKNPYSIHKGGWLEGPREFFTDRRARRAVRARLRYAVARYGWSQHVWAWELWNEVETSEGYEEDPVTDWHREMATFLKQIDIHGHLVTTSYRFTPPTTPCAAYGLESIDFINVHTYLPDLMRVFPDRVRAVEKFGRPVVISEFGLDVSPDYFGADPTGLHLHDGLWAGLFSGSAGAGMTWWWERYVHPRDLYHRFTGISEFMRGRDLNGLVPAASTVIGDAGGPESGHFSLALAGRESVLAWVGVRRRIATSAGVRRPSVSGYSAPKMSRPIVVRVHCGRAGHYDVSFFNTTDGSRVGGGRATCDGQSLDISVPVSSRDIAVECIYRQ
jgi:hypothetical protein